MPTIVVVGKGLATAPSRSRTGAPGSGEDVAGRPCRRPPGEVWSVRLRVRPSGGIDAVIFDWGGTLTRWHDVDFHAESLALAQAVVTTPSPDDDQHAHAARLHAAGGGGLGAQPRPPAQRDRRRPVRRGRARPRPGPAAAPTTSSGSRTPRPTPRSRPLFRPAARPTGSGSGCSRTPCGRGSGTAAIFARDGVLRPHRRRRLHQRDPLDQALSRAPSRPRWPRSAPPTRAAASTSATGSTTTSGVRSRPGCARCTCRTA